MEASQIPAKLPQPWATDASSSYMRTIPATTSMPGAASWAQGFPGPDTFTSLSAGGYAPDGRDMNGGLLMISAWAWWQAAGGPVYYDGTFSSAQGGYPAGATIAQAATLGAYWVSLIDNNTSDPDTGGANWLGIYPTSSLTLNEVVISATGAFSISIPSNAIVAGASGIATGGGGSAAGTTTGKTGGAGGAGGTAQGPIPITPGSNLTGSVGAGAVGGTTGADGNTGGNTTCGPLTGNGGGAGNFSASVAGGAPGSASGGTNNTNGGYGTDGLLTGDSAAWACGGASFWGGGGRAGSGAGLAGSAPGSGGGSCYGSAGSGGAGAAGRFVLRYWTI